MSTHKAFDSRLSESHQNGKRPKLLNEKNWNYNDKKLDLKTENQAKKIQFNDRRKSSGNFEMILLNIKRTAITRK